MCKIINFFFKNILENYFNFLINNIYIKMIFFFIWLELYVKQNVEQGIDF